MTNQFINLIGIPFLAGLVCLILPRKVKGVAEFIAILTSLVTVIFSVLVIKLRPLHTDWFLVDNLNWFLIPFIAGFAVLIILYSLKYFTLPEDKGGTYNSYYGYLMLTLSASFGTLVANHLVLLLIFWGFLGLTLYLLIQVPNPKSNVQGEKSEVHNSNLEDKSTAAKKTFIIIGGANCLLILGIALIWFLTNTFQIDQLGTLLTQSTTMSVIAFWCLVVAALAKSGAIPVHTWVPDMAAVSPVPVTAFLPASLDKILGIYLLARICLTMFPNVLKLNPNLNYILMLIGAITIIVAVFMEMIQHDMKKLLSYNAVSQVGYMVLGIGTGTALGIAGGIFHMINNTIYKTCLFLNVGAVENKTGTTDLDRLGGLVKFMPVTFITCLIAALSISGVPPFNGFVSKWMVYQSLIDLISKSTYRISASIFLVIAIFGSALTLASFVKLLHATFFGTSSDVKSAATLKEVSWMMYVPVIILAGLCIKFGILAFSLPIKMLILPALTPTFTLDTTGFIGLWQPGIATILILLGLIVGWIIFSLSRTKVRETTTFIGGETLPAELRVTGTDFYLTVKEMRFFKLMYFLAEKKVFDIYHWGKNIVLGIGMVLSSAHTGNLHIYLVWCLLGIIVLLFSFYR